MSIPEGATHKLTVIGKTKIENQIVDYFKRTDDGEWACFNSRLNCWLLSFRRDEDLHSMLEPIKQEKETQSVYTKEMYDAGELPKVGMEFFNSTKNCKQKVLAVTKFDDRDILTIHNDQFIVDAINFCDRYVKPIDQRTDKQKTIDEIEEFLELMANEGYATDAASLANWIIEGKFEFLKYTGKNND